MQVYWGISIVGTQAKMDMHWLWLCWYPSSSRAVGIHWHY